MVSLRAVALSLSCGLAGFVGAAEFFGENSIQAKIALPNGDTYIKGASDPVLNLNVTVTLTNKTKKEDLAPETVTLPDGTSERFEVDPFRKECLLNGWDEIDLTLQHEAAIAAHEARQRDETPWLAKP